MGSLIGTLQAARPAIWQAPSTTQRITNRIHKIPTGLSRQLRDTHAPKQQCSHRTSVVTPGHSTCNRQYHQSSCPRAVHNLRRLQAGWDACCQDLTITGCCSPSSPSGARDHINALELKAAFRATKAFLKDQSNITVCLCMDNTTATTHVSSANQPNSRTS